MREVLQAGLNLDVFCKRIMAIKTYLHDNYVFGVNNIMGQISCG